MSSDKIDQLMKLAERTVSDNIKKHKKIHQEFIKDIQFLRQRFEIERVNPHNHRITLRNKETGRRIFYPYNGYMLDNDVIKILDEVTYPEALRKSKQPSFEKEVA